jgi:hypothetical protein
MQVVGAINDRLWEFLWKQEEVGTATRHHASFTGLIHEHRHASGEMCIGLDEVVHNTLSFEILARKIAEAIATYLAYEVGVKAATTCPHRNVGGTPTRVKEHFAERVTTLQHLIIGTNQHVPCEVTNDAQTHAFTLPSTNSRPSRRFSA